MKHFYDNDGHIRYEPIFTVRYKTMYSYCDCVLLIPLLYSAQYPGIATSTLSSFVPLEIVS